jgi:hypothetical protein
MLTALPRGLTGYDVFDEIKKVPELKDIPVVLVQQQTPRLRW